MLKSKREQQRSSPLRYWERCLHIYGGCGRETVIVVGKRVPSLPLWPTISKKTELLMSTTIFLERVRSRASQIRNYGIFVIQSPNLWSTATSIPQMLLVDHDTVCSSFHILVILLSLTTSSVSQEAIFAF